MKSIFKKIHFLAIALLAVSSAHSNPEVDRSLSSKEKCCKKVICADLVKAKKVWTEKLDVAKDCKACRTITQEDFEDGKTFVIDEPGKYCLGESIHFEPYEEGAVAIIIDADDVKLDLCCNKLQLANNAAGVVGIQLPDNISHKNIIITNGTICGFTGAAFSAFFDILPDGQPGQPNIDGLCFSDLSIVDNGDGFFASLPKPATGINLQTDQFEDNVIKLAEQFAYRNVIVRNCKINRNAFFGIMTVNTNSLNIEDTQVNNTFALEGSFFGRAVAAYRFQFTENVIMTRCTGNDTRYDANAFSFGAHALNLRGVSNLQIFDSQFNRTHAEGGIFSSGFHGVTNVNVLVENCQFNGNTAGPNAETIQGLHQSEDPGATFGGNGYKFVNCQFSDMISTTNSVFGLFFQSGQDIVIDKCQFSNLQGERDGRNNNNAAISIGTGGGDPATSVVRAARNVVIKDCIISDISAVENNCFGIRLNSVGSSRDGVAEEYANIVIDNNIIERLRSGSPSDQVLGIGIFLNPNNSEPFSFLRNVFIRNNRISDIKHSVEEGNDDLVAGIFLESVCRPVICNNSISDTVNGIFLTGSDLINPPSFFQLAPTLQDALDVAQGVKPAIPPTIVDLTTLGTGMQNFKNIPQGNTVTVDASNGSFVRLGENGINTSPTDLNSLNWQAGDAVLYDAAGGTPIAELVDTTTYFAVVYVPGFTKDGIIQQNKVDNCRVAGYRDNNVDKDMNPVDTKSEWVDNNAFNNGSPASAAANYLINWGILPPVDAGSLTTAYPAPGNKYYNLSMIR